MASSATFLHLTDTHLRAATTELRTRDIKTALPGVTQDTREAAVDRLLAMVAERLESTNQKLDGVLFSGDAQFRGEDGGHAELLAAILKHLAPHGVSRGNIVATPGNHDVPRKSPPSSAIRYKAFLEAWGAEGCVIPWLDGDHESNGRNPHVLEATDKSWKIVPINSSNWCQTEVSFPDELATIWDRLPVLAAPADDQLQEKLARQLDALRVHDVPRVSPEQLEALRTMLRSDLSSPRQLRIAMMHHHLRAPSLREELKTFESITNQEHVRTFLREQDFVALLHGHKHETALTYEDIYADGEDVPHRLAVISGATFDNSQHRDAMRLVHLKGLPHNPSVEVEMLSVTAQGLEPDWSACVSLKLSQPRHDESAPVMITGTDITEVYERVVEAASGKAAGGIIIADLDLNPDVRLPLPEGFPLTSEMPGEDRTKWLQDIVAWWQLPNPKNVVTFPFPHGSRLRNYNGNFDQLNRIISLLKDKPTSRAIATLIDPARDFSETGTGEVFASFCLVEFKLQEVKNGPRKLDIIGFYRVQEFSQWWPVNVAELRQLQYAVAAEVPNVVVGRIVTIAGEARSERAIVQVAVSVLDRWHDQAPTLFHVLTTVLAGGRVDNELRGRAVDGWYRTLGELQKVASGSRSTGAPIPLKGLETFIDYLKANSGSSTDFDSFTSSVRSLRRLCQAHAESAKSDESYEEWRKEILQLLSTIQGLSDRLLLPQAEA
ncbi:metallophosphoesterase [Devosia sediminis]|uniref:Metallophosphoesterase n=1 Tax=Devosia sediminis TaxID=2798801 RepID=A0A934IRT6_9HYPH|nr:metallophosphoesterase [Devosia sediminis]MBJ3785619.1 metallophosphoesterase [Devosia sediminis]